MSDPNPVEQRLRDKHKLVWKNGKYVTQNGRQLTLNEQAFPSMSRPGHYVFDFTRRDDYIGDSLNIHVWGAPFAAKKYMEAVIADDEWCFELTSDGKDDKDSLITSSGIRIETNSTCFRGALWEVMNHEYSIAEMGWDLPSPYPRIAQAWRNNRTWTSLASALQTRSRGAPRASRNGMTTIQSIAEEYGMTPRDARGILRKAKVPKPPQGWAWKADDVQPIRDLMEKNK